MPLFCGAEVYETLTFPFSFSLFMFNTFTPREQPTYSKEVLLNLGG